MPLLSAAADLLCHTANSVNIVFASGEWGQARTRCPSHWPAGCSRRRRSASSARAGAEPSFGHVLWANCCWFLGLGDWDYQAAARRSSRSTACLSSFSPIGATPCSSLVSVCVSGGMQPGMPISAAVFARLELWSRPGQRQRQYRWSYVTGKGLASCCRCPSEPRAAALSLHISSGFQEQCI